MSEQWGWLLVATSAGPVGPTPIWSFSWLLGLPYSTNGWVPGEKKKCKRNRQKLFAFYYIALESHNVTFPVCKPTRFRKKHKPLLTVVGCQSHLVKTECGKKELLQLYFKNTTCHTRLMENLIPYQGCTKPSLWEFSEAAFKPTVRISSFRLAPSRGASLQGLNIHGPPLGTERLHYSQISIKLMCGPTLSHWTEQMGGCVGLLFSFHQLL